MPELEDCSGFVVRISYVVDIWSEKGVCAVWVVKKW